MLQDLRRDGFTVSIISEVKCARCDRKYSGVRSRCPYCGARRIGSGKYSEEGDNSKGKMIIGVLILSVLVVAAGVLLFTLPREDDGSRNEPEISDTETPSGLPGEEENSSLENTDPPPPSSPEPIESEPEIETPPPKVESVVILYAKTPIPDNEFSTNVTDKTPLSVRIEPAGVEFDDEIIWESSDKTVFEVVKDSTDGTTAVVTSIGSGSARAATLTVTVGDIKAECIVRVR